MARWKRLAATAVALSMFAPLLMACGDDDSSSSSDTTAAADGGVTVTTAANGTAVSVEVGDKSDDTMYLTPDTTSVPAGPVTFTMHNAGTVEHEMVVLKTDTPADQLTVGSDDKVSEDDSVGEVSETEAGDTGTLTVDLEPGKYVLVCNIAKHYGKGMYAAFTVTG